MLDEKDVEVPDAGEPNIEAATKSRLSETVGDI